MKICKRKKRLPTRSRSPTYFKSLGERLPIGPSKWDELTKAAKAAEPRYATYF
jgi:hypothetical protein